jgi:SAM-dependent methyltransferase
MGAAPGVQAIIQQYFPPHRHPYQILEQTILQHLQFDHTVLEIGCGAAAPNLIRLKGRANALIGIDVVDFAIADPKLLLVKANICEQSPLPSGSVDLSYSRSVMEHIEEVEAAYAEINRILRPGGKYIFLTPSAWDYASIIARLVPNRLHAAIVKTVEGRDDQDVFPTYYRSNTFAEINRISRKYNFEVDRFEYLGQYPSYLSFNTTLFRIGARYEKFLERHPRLHALRGWILCVLSKRPSRPAPPDVAGRDGSTPASGDAQGTVASARR